MAIEKMVMLSLLGSIDKEHDILEQVILSEKIHVNSDTYDSFERAYFEDQYRQILMNNKTYDILDINEQDETKLLKMNQDITEITKVLNNQLQFEKENITGYDLKSAEQDLERINKDVSDNIKEVNEKRSIVNEYRQILDKLKCIEYEHISLDELRSLKYFEYEIGFLSKEDHIHVKKNYENINAIILRLGSSDQFKENMYIAFYIKQYKQEITQLLKSLNWQKIVIPKAFIGSIKEIKDKLSNEIQTLENEINNIECKMSKNKEENILLLNKVYTRVKLESKIHELRQQIIHGENIIIFNAWVREKDVNKIEEIVQNITDKYVVMARKPSELPDKLVPPTLLKNNWFYKPFESIVKLYGLPASNELDPTPFLAITFCLMFGIMFGDLGQGFVYFLAGLLFLYKKSETIGGVLTRLGISSMIFGLVYGSFFGIEDIPILEHIRLITPLESSSILIILLMGIIFGIVMLTVSYLFGVINYIKKKDLQEALFGKNGVAGYLFFASLILTALSVTKIVNLSINTSLLFMGTSILLMIFKEPLTNLLLKKRPLIHGAKSEYYIESGFEGIETILSTLSNAISFIRVGAFALNHAGLFLAFLVISELMPNVALKFLILLIGNILILVLEGLVVFIQGLRLQYYEMFSKYFSGNGIEYKPIKCDE